jgi:trehalose-phosphatase
VRAINFIQVIEIMSLGKISMRPKVGFFFDYDGTLSPIDVERSLAYPPKKNLEMLVNLRSRGFITAVISSKDCDFLLSRSLNTDGLACINGVEIRALKHVILDERLFDQERRKLFVRLVEEAENRISKKVYIEKKRVSVGYIVGISIDWRSGGERPGELDDIIDLFKTHSFVVNKPDDMPFVDILLFNVEKGSAVEILRRLFDLDEVIYFGDSLNDVSAFRVADKRVFVRHKYNKNIKLESDYIVGFDELADWVINYSATYS